MSPEERLRLLDPAQERYALDLLDGLARGVIQPAPIDISGLARDVTAAIAQRDAARAVLQEAVEVLADLGLGVDTFLDEREIGLELALLLAEEWQRRDLHEGAEAGPEHPAGDLPRVDDYLTGMVESGLRVREATDE